MKDETPGACVHETHTIRSEDPVEFVKLHIKHVESALHIDVFNPRGITNRRFYLELILWCQEQYENTDAY